MVSCEVCAEFPVQSVTALCIHAQITPPFTVLSGCDGQIFKTQPAYSVYIQLKSHLHQHARVIKYQLYTLIIYAHCSSIPTYLKLIRKEMHESPMPSQMLV